VSRREFRRVLLTDLPEFEAQGWRPAIVEAGAVGCDPWCAGTLATVLVERTLLDRAELVAGIANIRAGLEAGEPE